MKCENTKIGYIPPWRYRQVNCITNLKIKNKDTTTQIEYKREPQNILEKHGDYQLVYTDGSKTLENADFAFSINGSDFTYKIPNQCSIFTAEMNAIIYAISNINNNPSEYLVMTDSLSAIQAIQQTFPKSNLSCKIREMITEKYNVNLKFCWIPSHVGITGNEKVDQLAKSSCNLDNITNIPMPVADIFPIVKKCILNKWQRQWDELSSPNKLKMIKHDVLPWETSSRDSRQEEVVLVKLRIGHTRLTHRYLIDYHPPPMFTDCSEHLSTEHIISNCNKYNVNRINCKLSNNLKIILSNNETEIRKLMKYLYETKLLNEL